ncbi:MAG: thioesterase family protein [Acidobacteriota bacterium]
MDYCDHRLRVRYAETDQMGLAYHANHLIWFEIGRTEFCRQGGFTYEAMERETGSRMVVAELSCRYRRPLRYDQEFIIRTRIRQLRKRTLTFAYQILDALEGTLLAEGETKHVVTDSNGRPRSFPAQYLHCLKGLGQE